MSSPDDVRAARARRSTAWLVGLALLVVGLGLATVVVPELRDEPEEPAPSAETPAPTADAP